MGDMADATMNFEEDEWDEIRAVFEDYSKGMHMVDIAFKHKISLEDAKACIKLAKEGW